MKTVKTLLRLLLLPLDLIFLTYEFIRWSKWLTDRWIRQRLRLMEISRSPCKLYLLDRQGIETRRPSGGVQCRCGGKFFNLFVFRLLCPSVRRGDPTSAGMVETSCENPHYFHVPFLRYLAVLLLLSAFWWGVAAGVASSLQPLRSHFKFTRPSKSGAAPREASAAEFTRSGQRLLARKQWNEARLQFKNALRQDENHVEALMGLGVSALQLGILKEAESTFRSVIAHAPAAATGRVYLAEIALRKGDRSQALASARQAASGEALSAKSLLRLTALCRAAGDTDYALDLAERAAGDESVRTNALSLAGALALERKDLARAEQHYRTLLELQPGPAGHGAALGLAAARRLRGDAAGAITDLRALLDARPGDPATLAEWASACVAAGDLPAAIAAYEELLRQNVNQRTIRGALVETLLRAGRANEAFREAERLLQDNPRDAVPHLAIAEVFLSRGLSAPALRHAREAAALAGPALAPGAQSVLARTLEMEGDPAAAAAVWRTLAQSRTNNLSALLGQARSLHLSGQTRLAQEVMRLAQDRHPGSVAPSLYLAELERSLGNVKQAEKLYANVLARDPNHLTAMNNLAALLLDTHPNDTQAVRRAGGLIERAAQLAPYNPAVADTLGWSFYLRGDYARAVPPLDYAARQRPRDATTRYRLGAALLARGDVAELARRQLETALRLSTNFVGRPHAEALLRAAPPAAAPPNG